MRATARRRGVRRPRGRARRTRPGARASRRGRETSPGARRSRALAFASSQASGIGRDARPSRSRRSRRRPRRARSAASAPVYTQSVSGPSGFSPVCWTLRAHRQDRAALHVDRQRFVGRRRVDALPARPMHAGPEVVPARRRSARVVLSAAAGRPSASSRPRFVTGLTSSDGPNRNWSPMSSASGVLAEVHHQRPHERGVAVRDGARRASRCTAAGGSAAGRTPAASS